MKVSRQDLPNVLARAQGDPEWWLTEILGASPWELQKHILYSVRDHRRTAVRSCNGAGKSWIAARIVLWFLHAFPYSIVVTTATTFRQVKNILWQEIGAAHRNSNYPLGSDCLTTEIKIAPKWYAFGFSTDDPVAAQGIHADYVLVVVDEAAGVEQEIWDSLDGCLTSDNARFLAIGNPTDPTGPFAKEFESSSTARYRISAFDTPNFTEPGITIEDIRSGDWEEKQAKYGKLPNPQLVTPQWVADKWRRWCGSREEGETSPLWVARVLGDFPESRDDTLISLAWVLAAQERFRTIKVKKDDYARFGVDVGRFGGDESTIYECKGKRILLIDAFHKTDTMETTGRIVKANNDRDPDDINVDVIGIGAGVVDRLRELGYDVKEANAAHKASDPEKYGNARGEWFWLFREDLDPKGDGELWALDPQDEELAAQLTGLRYKIDSRGRVMLESKEDMRRRGVPSPDRADGAVISTLNLEDSGFFIV